MIKLNIENTTGLLNEYLCKETPYDFLEKDSEFGVLNIIGFQITYGKYKKTDKISEF